MPLMLSGMTSISGRSFNWVNTPSAWSQIQSWRAKQQEGRDNFESASSTAASNFYGASASLASGMAAVAARIASNRVQAKAIQAALNKLA